MNGELELDGQVAVVTGSGRGFGRAIAQGLAVAGASVVATSRTRSEIDETVKSIEDAGGRALSLVGDVTSLHDVQNLRKAAEERFGPVSLAIHCAGVPWPFGPTWLVEPDRWWHAQEIHVRGAMHCINTFVPGMVERHNGRVILVSSEGGRKVTPFMSGYGLAKATQIRLTEFLAMEGRDVGVAAFSVHPGDEITEISQLTMSDPDAQRWVPWFVSGLSGRQQTGEDASAGFRACASLCVQLGSGRYDRLSGHYLTPDDDLDSLLDDGAIESEPEPRA